MCPGAAPDAAVSTPSAPRPDSGRGGHNVDTSCPGAAPALDSRDMRTDDASARPGPRPSVRRGAPAFAGAPQRLAAFPPRTPLPTAPVPATGAWRPGDDPGRRQLVDVGDLDRIIQIDAPHSVASFLQRLGRTGRRVHRPASSR